VLSATNSDPARSAADRSWAVFPNGGNGEFNLPKHLSRVIVRGNGCAVWDSEGRPYLDFSMGWGSALVGHARPEIVAAVGEQVARGANFAYVTDRSLELAEAIVRISPACERVRFCASGTEATMVCLRLARASTGREGVLRFEGAYHGAHDVGVTSLFPQGATPFPQAQPSSAGLGPTGDVLVAPFNDLDFAAHLCDQRGDQIAAVIVEPLQRCIPPADGFLAGLRDLCSRHGIVLIFDEVVTGFRLALGGAQEYYGVVPDLVAYGKALGGGMPIGAYGGRREIMDLVREDRMGSDTFVWTASTLGGNPVSSAAALAALNVLGADGAYDHLHKLGDYLRQEMRRVLLECSVPAHVIGDGPLAQVVFSDQAPRDYRTSRHRDPPFARRLLLKLFERGIFLNPMGTKLYLSLAHDEKTCDAFCERLAATLPECVAAEHGPEML
jgi:glutamate-1-semialdehyde 2,1-aminomutase